MNIVYYNKDEHKEWLFKQFSDLEIRIKLQIVGTPDAEGMDKGLSLILRNKDNCLIGFVRVDHPDRTGKIYLRYFLISKRYRKQGLGKKLLEESLIRISQNYYVEEVYCFILENISMEKLLKSKGFENRGVYKKFVYSGGKFLDQTLFIKKL